MLRPLILIFAVWLLLGICAIGPGSANSRLLSPHLAKQTADDEVSAEVLGYIEEAKRLFNARRYDEALAAYKMAEEKAHKAVFTIYLGVGAVYFEKREFEPAAEAYNKAIAMRPGDFRPHYNLAEVLYSKGDYKGAEAQYRKTIELSPKNNPQAHQFLALSLYNQKRLEEAIAEFKVAIAQSPRGYGEAHYNLGIAYMDLGDNKSAEAEFRIAVEQDRGREPQDHYNLALVLEKQKRFAEAADEYEAYLKLAPNAPDANKLRAHIASIRKQK
jgi:tetratricopeptide (TPR) repeat protein